MNLLPFEMLACPLDGEQLRQKGKQWQCINGHSFDEAKQGYINLLPAHFRRSRDPGDSRQMVAARSAFLQNGYYLPIATAVNETLQKHIDTAATCVSCLDAGCGEGYYAGQMQQSTEYRDIAFLGMDVSKWAILGAARKLIPAKWIVATNARIPVSAGAFDFVLCIFGFPVYQEFLRVLKPGGKLIKVDAGESHLRELREIIYPQMKQQKTATTALDTTFSLIEQHAVKFPFFLDNRQQISDLLTMTPHRYRADAQGLAKLSEHASLGLNADAKISVYEARH
ncbi:MAG: methyltransferase domain-containing protein [Pseudomonadales bacterium]|nr:methyltransferase domain-containing protein [Pseudomonadales bacterium]